eukprot:1360131-Amorphochlora_amoeboformis.AAC.2
MYKEQIFPKTGMGTLERTVRIVTRPCHNTMKSGIRSKMRSSERRNVSVWKGTLICAVVSLVTGWLRPTRRRNKRPGRQTIQIMGFSN